MQFALSAGAPPKGSMLAGLEIFNTVIGGSGSATGAAMTMVVGLFIALCIAGLYLVVVRPRRRIVAVDRGDGLDVSPIRTDPRAWARLRRDPMPGARDGPGASAARPGRAGSGGPPGRLLAATASVPARHRPRRTARLDRHRQRQTGGRPVAGCRRG